MQKQNHHYLPKFYLKKWLNPQKFFYGYHYTMNNKLVEDKWYPESTGCCLNLYTRTNKDGYLDFETEAKHFAPLDGDAANVYIKILNNNLKILTLDEKIIWGKFLISLLVRQRENIEDAKECVINALKNTPVNDSVKNSDEYINFKKNAHIDIIAASSGQSNDHKVPLYQELLDSILDTNWFLLDCNNISYDLLTCDKPTRSCDLINLSCPSQLNIRTPTDCFSKDNMFLAFPITPNKCFVTSHAFKNLNLTTFELKSIIKYLNLLIIKSARQFVLSNSKQASKFIFDNFNPYQMMNTNSTYVVT